MKLRSSSYILLILVSISSLLQYYECNASQKKKDATERVKNNVMKNFYKMNSPDDISKLGIRLEKVHKPASIIGRTGKAGSPAALMEPAQDATPGKCDPKPVCISNPLIYNLTTSQLAFPPCINIHRCDGCCPTNEKCVPIKSHEVRLQKVGIIDFVSETSAKYTDSFVSVLNHTECQCQCQWADDAECQKVNPNYVKSPYFCECVCPEELSCSAYHEFDKESCSCKCKRETFQRMEHNCRTRGFSWNDVYCRCDPVKYTISAKEIKIDKAK